MAKHVKISEKSTKLLDLSEKQSNIYSCPEVDSAPLPSTISGFISSQISASQLELFVAKKVGRILSINTTTGYTLRKQGLLDFWQIHGTMETNLAAIISFLERNKNTELQIP